MVIVRFFGWLLIVLALGALGWEAFVAWQTGGWRMVPLGELWFKLHSNSLNASQAGIQRYVAPWLWEPVITTILLWPGWAVFGVPGVLLLWAGRKKSRR
jgi:hypothetical protein